MKTTMIIVLAVSKSLDGSGKCPERWAINIFDKQTKEIAQDSNFFLPVCVWLPGYIWDWPQMDP